MQARALIRTDQEALLQLLREIRKEANLSQKSLAQKLQKPQSFVSKYEAGERRLDILELRQICDAVSIVLSEFVQRLEEKLKEHNATR
jgi:transcriptional regulator with XRE-family HTH domain